MENYLIAMATFGCFYALLALGLNLVWGMTGMINLGLVGFFAFGAYVSALATKRGGAPMALGVAGAAPLIAAGGAADGAAARRLPGDHHAGLLRGRAPGRQQRDLAHQRHRRYLRHPGAVAGPRDAGDVQCDLPRAGRRGHAPGVGYSAACASLTV